MRARPDLTYPLAPDLGELPIPGPSRPTGPPVGGDLRADWDGPESPKADKGKGKMVGPNQAKVVAAMTGASVSALLMTPFDVLKTRLQTVRPLPRRAAQNRVVPPIEACCQTSLLSDSSHNPALNSGTCLTASTSTAPRHGVQLNLSSLRPPEVHGAPAPNGCLYPSKWAGIWGEAMSLEQALARGLVGVGNGASGTLVLPAEGALEGVVGGFWTELAAVRKEAGTRGLWKGVGTTLTMAIPSAAIYMLGYEHLLSRISPYFNPSADPSAHTSSLNRSASSLASSSVSITPAPLLAGSLARTLSATVISPIEMFRTRLQALPSIEKGSPTYASTTADMAQLVRTKGLPVLWRGLGPTLWRDVPFSGAYWAGFEILKSRMSQPTVPTSSLSPVTISFLSGAIAGTFSALLTQPFDVLKTRRQVFTPSPECSPEALRHRATTIPLAVHVIKTEGWGALFAGVVPRCGKVAPACGLMIACYEGVGRWLGEKEA